MRPRMKTSVRVGKGLHFQLSLVARRGRQPLVRLRPLLMGPYHTLYRPALRAAASLILFRQDFFMYEGIPPMKAPNDIR